MVVVDSLGLVLRSSYLPTRGTKDWNDHDYPWHRAIPLGHGKTAVFISHRMSSTQFCDNIAVINQGHVVEYGNHKTLLALKDGLYKKMWDAQAQYYK